MDRVEDYGTKQGGMKKKKSQRATLDRNFLFINRQSDL